MSKRLTLNEITETTRWLQEQWVAAAKLQAEVWESVIRRHLERELDPESSEL
jgi:hypothetical protein